MAKKIRYEFDDLRRNDDPMPDHVAGMFGAEETEEKDEKPEPKPEPKADQRREVMERRAERRVKEAEERANRRIKSLEERLEKQDARLAEQTKRESEDRIKGIEDRLKVAAEDQDVEQQVKLQRELAEAIADQRAPPTQTTASDQLEERNETTGDPTVRAKVDDWIAQQDEWFEDRGDMRKYLEKVDRRLQARGIEPASEEYFELVEANLEKKFPGVIVKTAKGTGEDDVITDLRSLRNPRRREQTPELMDDNEEPGSHGSSRRPKAELNRMRRANMIAFGMDPDNEDHVERYMLEAQDD